MPVRRWCGAGEVWVLISKSCVHAGVVVMLKVQQTLSRCGAHIGEEQMESCPGGVPMTMRMHAVAPQASMTSKRVSVCACAHCFFATHAPLTTAPRRELPRQMLGALPVGAKRAPIGYHCFIWLTAETTIPG